VKKKYCDIRKIRLDDIRTNPINTCSYMDGYEDPTWWQRHRGSFWWCKWYGPDPSHPDELNFWGIGFIAPFIHRNFTVVFVPESLYVEVWVSQNIWTQWRAEHESIRDTYHWKFGGI